MTAFMQKYAWMLEQGDAFGKRNSGTKDSHTALGGAKILLWCLQLSTLKQLIIRHKAGGTNSVMYRLAHWNYIIGSSPIRVMEVKM